MSFKAKVSTLKKFRLLFIGLLISMVIIACQNNAARQPTSLPIANCRTVQHALGEVCVPQTPQRLVSLDQITLADALALGVPSIGSAIRHGVQIGYLTKYMENYDRMELVGQSNQPSLEKILKLKPDLVMGIEFFGKPIFPLLSQIAPTAVGDWTGLQSWRKYFNFVASVLNKEDEAKQIWDNYHRRIAEIKTALSEELQNTEVSSIYIYANDIGIEPTNSFSGGILKDIGIRQPESHVAVESGAIALSAETILDIDADVLFVSVFDYAESKQTLANWQQKSLWKQLKAVKKRQVYIVNANIWRGGNPIAANLVLDDLFKYLVE